MPSLFTASHLNHPSSSDSASIRDSVPLGNERIRREDDIRSDPSVRCVTTFISEAKVPQNIRHLYQGARIDCHMRQIREEREREKDEMDIARREDDDIERNFRSPICFPHRQGDRRRCQRAEE